MILSYCERCGTFIRADQFLAKGNDPILCGDCTAGVRRVPTRMRHSDRIPNPFRKAFRAGASSAGELRQL